MNKDNAIRAMHDGHKVTHRWFLPGEWMKLAKDYKDMYVFEDGCISTSTAFWDLRQDHTWQDGWILYAQPIDNLDGEFSITKL